MIILIKMADTQLKSENVNDFDFKYLSSQPPSPSNTINVQPPPSPSNTINVQPPPRTVYTCKIVSMLVETFRHASLQPKFMNSNTVDVLDTEHFRKYTENEFMNAQYRLENMYVERCARSAGLVQLETARLLRDNFLNKVGSCGATVIDSNTLIQYQSEMNIIKWHVEQLNNLLTALEYMC